jgi:hypothetical protein
VDYKMLKIAAITMARNDTFNLNRWLDYYGRELGFENLFVYLDGTDQETPSNAGRANITKLPHRELSRLRGDKYRINLLSDLAEKLFAKGYDLVIGTDSDEFLIVDPKQKTTLKKYLSDSNIKKTVSGLGLDVGQHLNREYELDTELPFLTQREYALLSTRFTKASVMARPLRWGSGFHKMRGTNFHIDSNLYLLHFGSVDYEQIRKKMSARDKSWNKHTMRRAENIILITNKRAHNLDKVSKLARFIQTVFRPIYALNKPSMLGMKWVVKLPERFKKTGV